MTLKTDQCLPSPLNNNLSLDELYNYYRNNVENQKVYLNGNLVKFFSGLRISSTEIYPEAFHHITTKKDKTNGIRVPEERRFYINYIVPMIKNYESCNNCGNKRCLNLKMWTKTYTNRKKRVMLLYSKEDFNYMVVLEYDHKKKNELNVITSYLANEKWFIKKANKDYEKYLSQKKTGNVI